MPTEQEKAKVGRPTKCTPELTKQFAEYMAAGLYLEDAAGLCHITERTAYRWFEWGRDALEEADNYLDAVTDEKYPYAAFCHAVRAAEAAALARNLALVQRGAQDRDMPLGANGKPMLAGDWRAAAEFLKMRKPDTWGNRKQTTEHTGPGGGPVQVSWIDRLKADCSGGDEDE